MLLPFARPGGLGFPGGPPGFDPSHIASKNIRFSGVGPSFENLVNNAPPLTISRPASIDRTLGRVADCGSATSTGLDISQTNTGGGKTPTQATIAGVARFSDLSTFNGIFADCDSNGVASLFVDNASNLMMRVAGNNVASSLAMTAGIPYFCAASVNQSTGVNFLLLRLDTGLLQTQTVATSVTMPASPVAQRYIISNWESISFGMTGSLAAVMYNWDFLSIPQLVQWAKNPWAFWYPARRVDMATLFSLAAGAAVVAPSQGGTAELFSPQLGPDWRPFNFRPRLAYSAAVAATTNVTADSGAPIEVLAGLRSDALTTLENLASLRADALGPLEDLTGQRSDVLGSLEVLAGQRSDALAPLEGLAGQRSDSIAPLETTGALRSDALTPLETLAGQRSDILASLETLAGVRSDSPAPVEILAGVRRDSAVPIENQGAIGVTGDGAVQIETTAAFRSDVLAPLETLAGTRSDALGHLETLAGTRTDVAAPAESLGLVGVVGNAAASIETLTTPVPVAQNLGDGGRYVDHAGERDRYAEKRTALRKAIRRARTRLEGTVEGQEILAIVENVVEEVPSAPPVPVSARQITAVARALASREMPAPEVAATLRALSGFEERLGDVVKAREARAAEAKAKAEALRMEAAEAAADEEAAIIALLLAA